MPSGPWIGGLALTGAVLVYVLLLAAVRRADRGFLDPTESTWWFGYSRDLSNLAGAVLYAGAFGLLGLAGPLAILAGFGLGLLTYGLDYLLARRLAVPRPGVALFLTAAPAAILCALLHGPLARGLATLVDFLFSAPFARTGRG